MNMLHRHSLHSHIITLAFDGPTCCLYSIPPESPKPHTKYLASRRCGPSSSKLNKYYKYIRFI